MNGDKLALLRECFFVENSVFARGLRRQNIHLKGIKGHLTENNFGNISKMLIESKSIY